MLAGLYIGYVIILAKLKPNLMPPLSESERKVPLPMSYTELGEKISQKVIPALLVGLKGKRNINVSGKEMLKSLLYKKPVILPKLLSDAYLLLPNRVYTNTKLKQKSFMNLFVNELPVMPTRLSSHRAAMLVYFTTTIIINLVRTVICCFLTLVLNMLIIALI